MRHRKINWHLVQAERGDPAYLHAAFYRKAKESEGQKVDTELLNDLYSRTFCGQRVVGAVGTDYPQKEQVSCPRCRMILTGLQGHA